MAFVKSSNIKPSGAEKPISRHRPTSLFKLRCRENSSEPKFANYYIAEVQSSCEFPLGRRCGTHRRELYSGSDLYSNYIFRYDETERSVEAFVAFRKWIKGGSKRKKNVAREKLKAFQWIGNQNRFALSLIARRAVFGMNVKVDVTMIVYNTIKLDCEMWVILTWSTFVRAIVRLTWNK